MTFCITQLSHNQLTTASLTFFIKQPGALKLGLFFNSATGNFSSLKLQGFKS